VDSKQGDPRRVQRQVGEAPLEIGPGSSLGEGVVRARQLRHQDDSYEHKGKVSEKLRKALSRRPAAPLSG
jgi:hypothetical protein